MKFFLTVGCDQKVEKTICIADHLQNIIDFLKDNPYLPYQNVVIYECYNQPMSVRYVDGKILIS